MEHNDELSQGELRKSARAIVAKLKQAGHVAYWAGGCVRDMLMGRTPKDYDIATSASPDQVQELFPKTVGIGKAFGVIQVLLDGHPFEVATFRHDLPYLDGRRPSGVEFSNAEEDAKRRDFTINAMFYDPLEDRIIDFVDGRKDLEAGLIRTVGDPEARFSEDYLRMLRAVRFSSTLEFLLDAATAEAIRRLAGNITKISVERIQQELTRLLVESPKPGCGLTSMLDLGLLQPILPEVAAMKEQPQPPAFHPEGDVFTHTAMMLDRMRDPSPALAYAVLLHDVGKPSTARLSIESDGSERIRFDAHASVGGEMAESILRRLKLPSKDIEAAVQCVRNHMTFMDVRKMRQAKLRRLVGSPTFPLELELHRLDCLCSHGDLSNYDFLLKFQEDLKNEPALPERWVTGQDVLALGVPEGPEVGRLLRKAYEAQIEGRFGSREELLAWMRDNLPHSAES